MVFEQADLPRDPMSIPRIAPPEVQHRLRMFFLIDPDGSLLRCIDNKWGREPQERSAIGVKP